MSVTKEGYDELFCQIACIADMLEGVRKQAIAMPSMPMISRRCARCAVRSTA